MSSKFSPTVVAEVIETLLGRDVTVKGGAAGKPADSLIAVYVTPEKAIAACVGASMEFACYSAAALSLVPREVAEADVRAGRLSDVLDENFREVMNVFGGMLSKAGSRVVLDRIVPVGEAPAEAVKLLNETVPATFEVDVGGYGKGRISLGA